MVCPICGAKCVCRNRGDDGRCCGCHKHKARARKLGITTEALAEQHREAGKPKPEQMKLR